jgi:Flp pilus assembly protein TadG
MKTARAPTSMLARHRGGAIIEFALIVGVMLTMLAGIVEFGRMFWYYDALSKATRNAARTLSVASKATIASAGLPAAKAIVVQAASDAGVPSFLTSNVTVTCLDTNLVTTACADGTAPAAVKVEITGYKITLGDFIPFMIGSASSEVYPAPSSTMPYVPLS